MGFEFSLKWSETAWWRHFWCQTVPISCCGDRERSVFDRIESRVTGTTSAEIFLTSYTYRI